MSSGTALSITTPAPLPASARVTLSNAGTYYWQATYSGDSSNLTSTSTCGAEIETVTPVPFPTSVTTSLSGGGSTRTRISVPAGTQVTDAATLSGANAATATGTVTYDVYSDAACTVFQSAGTPENITTAGLAAAVSRGHAERGRDVLLAGLLLG